MSSDICTLSAVEMARLIRARELSARDLVAAHLDRIARINPTVNAIVSSGYAMDATMSRYQDYGFRGVIAKPYEAAELGRIVHDVIASSQINLVSDYPMQATG